MIEGQAREQLVEVGGGITLCYERFGVPSDPALVLISGLGQQLLMWPDAMCEALSARNLHVVRFDNRDIGRSSHVRTPPPRTGQLITRRFHPDQYKLSDMARDTAGLIDALELGSAHVVGASMGAMIGQVLAIEHPRHVRSLVSIMSSTGAPNVGWTAPSTLRLMFRPPPADRDAAAERAVTMWRHIGSHGFSLDEQRVRDLAARSFDRDRRAVAGAARQLAAVLSSGDRTKALRGINAPTLVIHGDRDLMVHPSGGRATAAAIPNARHVMIAGMGHDLPAGALPRIIDLITEHAAPADGATDWPAVA